MRKMKKNLVIKNLLIWSSVFILLLALAGCGGNPPQPEGDINGTDENGEGQDAIDETNGDGEEQAAAGTKIINIGVLRGPTGMGAVKLMDNEKYNITLLGSPDDLVGKIITGELDLAAVPTNFAPILYQRTGGEIKLVALHTLGILYILENGTEIETIGDLAGKTLHISGRGSIPDYVIQYLLKEHGLVPGEDVILDFSAQHADLAAMMTAGQRDLALLPQPYVTSVLMQNEDVRIALDLTQEWRSALNSELPMGVLIGQKDFIVNNNSALKAFLADYEESIRFVNTNVEEAAELIAEYQILPNAQIAARAIPFCNIVYFDAQDSKESLDNFFKILYDLNPESIGGTVPDDEFYYVPAP